MSLEQQIRERLERMAMSSKVTASPEAKRFLASEGSTDGNYEEEIDYLAEHALAVACAIAEGKTGAADVRLRIRTELERWSPDGVNIVVVETEIGEHDARHWISVE